MDNALLIICIISLFISAISLAVILVLFSKLRKLSEKDSQAEQFKDLKESIYNEFSRNRSEQIRLLQSQREELAVQIAAVTKGIDTLSETNREQLIRIFREMNSAINQMREKNAELSEAQNKRISESLEKIRESNEKKLDEMLFLSIVSDTNYKSSGIEIKNNII